MRIETERLILRPMGLPDLQDLLDLHAEPAIIEFLGGATAESARERLERCERNWGEGRYDLMAVLNRLTGEFLGRAGVKYWPEFNETEAGWAFRRAVWGQGYATEAARASIDWAFRTLPVPYVTAMIRPDNSRSQAVARRLGFAPLRDDVVVGVPVTVHAVKREAWGAAPRSDEAERLLAHTSEWACAREDLVAVGVAAVTSAGAELLLVSPNPEGFPDAEQWASELGVVVLATERRGGLIEHRLATASGLELRVTIVSVPPQGGGWRALYDPQGILEHITDAVA